MLKTFLVTYKTGRSQVVTGNVVLFSSMNTDVMRPDNAVYLNADELLSVIEQSGDKR